MSNPVLLKFEEQQSGKLTEWKLNKQLFHCSTTQGYSRRKRKAKSRGMAMRLFAESRQEVRGEERESGGQGSAITIKEGQSVSGF